MSQLLECYNEELGQVDFRYRKARQMVDNRTSGTEMIDVTAMKVVHNTKLNAEREEVLQEGRVIQPEWNISF